VFESEVQLQEGDKMNESKWGDGATLNPDKILDYVGMAFDRAADWYLSNDPPKLPDGFEEKRVKTIQRIYQLLAIEKGFQKALAESKKLTEILLCVNYFGANVEEGRKQLEDHGVRKEEYPA
jgi:hypothetical protein